MGHDPFGNPFNSAFGLSSSEIFRRPVGGGARGPRKPAQAPESEPEPMAPEPQPVAEDNNPADKVTLKNPKWEVEDVGFNEETDLSVEVILPASQAHKTRVDFELFAKTPQGPESISKCQGAVKDGKAVGRIPVYIPQYRDEDGNLMAKVEYFFTAKHSGSDLLKDEKVVKEVDHLAERLIESHVLADITFATGRSFPSPRQAEALKALAQRALEWKEKYPEGKLAIFGHADAVGKEDFNKKLSERRGRAIHAFLVADAGEWAILHDEEKWGLETTQELLKHLGHDPGTIDGKDGPKTQAAVKEFQAKKGLAVDGKAGPMTREALYRAFMEACGAPGLKVKDFDAIDGKAFAGCSEFNLVEKKEGACEANRRVAVLLLKSNKNFPIQYPCKQGDIGPCKSQVGRKGERRTAGFGCLFYDKLVVESAMDFPLPPQKKLLFDPSPYPDPDPDPPQPLLVAANDNALVLSLIKEAREQDEARGKDSTPTTSASGDFIPFTVVDKFQEPPIRMDHGFLDDGFGNLDDSKRRGVEASDIAALAKWRAMLTGAELLRPDLIDATRFYRHFLEGFGADLFYRYESYVAQDRAGARTLDSAVEDAIAAAIEANDRFASSGSFKLQTKAIGVGGGNGRFPYPGTENWQKAIGAHVVWLEVEVEVRGFPDHREFRLKMTLHAVDRYNFNPNAKDIATGAKDEENGRFEVTGLAREFVSRSNLKRRITFRTTVEPVPDPRMPPDGKIVVPVR